KLQALRDSLVQTKNAYWADQVEIQRRAALGWVAWAEGKNEDALRLMRSAADLEDGTEKHPVTPGAILPARELLGEMLLELKQPAQAVREFETSMGREPDRYNGTYGAARAAELSGDLSKAKTYYAKLVTFCDKTDTHRAGPGSLDELITRPPPCDLGRGGAPAEVPRADDEPVRRCGSADERNAAAGEHGRVPSASRPEHYSAIVLPRRGEW